MQRANTPLLKTLLFGLTTALAFSPAAQAWWDSGWTARKQITLDTSASGAAIAEPIGDVPVLIRLYDGNFAFAAAKADGSDLRFISADDKTPLSYHIEKYDGLLHEAFVWVKVPGLASGARTSFWLYYGNGGNKAARADDAKGTYDPDTVLVYHFAEHGQPASDSSSFGNHALNPGAPVDGSIIGTGLRFDAHNSVTIPASASLAWARGAPLTWSAWVKPAGPQPNAVLYRRQDGRNTLLIGLAGDIPYVEVTEGGVTRRSPPGAPIAANTWRHLAVVAAGAKMSVYLDGAAYSALDAALPAMTGPAGIGGSAPVGPGTTAAEKDGYVGEMDELSLSRIARPAGFIKFAALSQGGDSSAKLLGFGEEEQPKDWLAWLKGGYVGVIIGSLSLDGWVVIAILAVMAVISWCVMIGKAAYLNRVVKGNALFLKEWRHVASDLSVLDHGDTEKAKTMGGRVDTAGQRAMHAAPLYRVYHIAIEEIRHRMAVQKKGGKVLSARSIQAIRASLDGGLVRETQRLSSQMVLLTIAISGGPFLGLLGTVVGVMITFAAVAAAGDVNVNAIAPGIAAALAATVAGLAVAIPSLFGYNYLLTRIKATTSDMHVFIDELVAKMAEFYSETSSDEP